MGVSPKKYLTDVRMQKAAKLLTQSSDAVTEIAKKTGYPDLFSFSRAFSKYYNCPPSEYKRTT